MEAVGEIINVYNLTQTDLIGKRVAIILDANNSSFYHGLWAQYAYVKLENCIFYGNDISWEKMLFNINPLTCCGLIDTCKKKGADSVFLDAAASDLGIMFNKLCQKENIKVFNLIRNKDEQLDLEQIGAEYIIDISKSDWEKDCLLISEEFKPKLCFDCIGGNTTSTLMKILPFDSTLYHFGNLSEKAIDNISSRDLIFYNKKLKGWWLPLWLNKLSYEELNLWQKLIVGIKESNLDIFHTKVTESYKIDDISSAWKAYSGDMNKGKVLIYPHWKN
jgi:NADPH:quinone reductase-like Zn-dependent oxidoreductase